jgi:hypothetical protein
MAVRGTPLFLPELEHDIIAGISLSDKIRDIFLGTPPGARKEA